MNSLEVLYSRSFHSALRLELTHLEQRHHGAFLHKLICSSNVRMIRFLVNIFMVIG